MENLEIVLFGFTILSALFVWMSIFFKQRFFLLSVSVIGLNCGIILYSLKGIYYLSIVNFLTTLMILHSIKNIVKRELK